MRNVGILLILALGIAGGCNKSRPNGGTAEAGVVITTITTADGEIVGSARITGSETIEVQGTMVDPFGIESATYSWRGSGMMPLPLGIEGGFLLELPMAPGPNTLELEGSSVVGGDPVKLELIYTLDSEGPVIMPPTDEFAASITSESEMVIDKDPTIFTLSGGFPVFVTTGLSFSKYSSTWAPGNENLPVWRFNLVDEYALDDAMMQFRVLHRDDFGVEEVFVDWADMTHTEDAEFEAVISSALDERISKVSGNYVLEAKAFDSAGNESEIVQQLWRQSIVNPPIYIETGSEAIMSSGGPLDPTSYQIGVDFSELNDTEGLEIGSIRIGNPNSIPVLVQLDPSDLTGLASHTRKETAYLLASDSNGPDYAPCDWNEQYVEVSTGNCRDWPNYSVVWRDRLADTNNDSVQFRIEDVGGNSIDINNNTFVMPPNTVFHGIAFLEDAPGNLMDRIDDSYFSEMGRAATSRGVRGMLICLRTSGVDGSCIEFELHVLIEELLQHFVTWDFIVNVKSSIRLDETDPLEFDHADLDGALGYARQIAVSHLGYALPTSHSDLEN